MRREEVRHALDAMASDMPAPTADAQATITRGRRRIRQRRITLAGVIALLVVIVVAAGAIARDGDGEPHVASVPTTIDAIDVKPQPPTTTTPPQPQPIPIPMAFVSPTEGWLCSAPTVEYTTDAGATWTNAPGPIHEPAAPRYQYPVCAAVPGGEAWVAAASPGVDRVRLMHITDGGRDLELLPFPQVPSGYVVDQLTFADSRNGWAHASNRAGSGTVALLTRDGGHTWQLGGNSIGVPRFSTPTDGWAPAGPSDLAHTTDGGFTWHDVAVPRPDPVPGLPVGVGPPALVGDTVVAIGSNPTGNLTGLFFDVSTDGGRTWRMQTHMPPSTFGTTEARAFSATDADHWQLSESNRLWTTDDGGQTWKQVAEFAGISAITDVHFLTPEIGFVSVSGGTSDTYSATEVLQTNDGGANWSMVAEHSPPMSERGPINFPGGIFGCPTHPLAAPPPGNPPAGLIDAATRWAEANDGPVATVDATYRVGEQKGEFWQVFNFQIPSCGPSTVAASWVVEMHGPIGQGGGGSTDQTQVVLAYSPDGWHAYGRYH